MGILRKTIDWVFPLKPEEPQMEGIKMINKTDIKGKGTILANKVEAAQKCYDEENERAKIIENKASMFITSTGFLGTVLIGTSTFLLGKTIETVSSVILILLCLLAFVVYMLRTILYSLKALQRAVYFFSDPNYDISDKDEFNRKRIYDLVNSCINNQIATNKKVDYVVLAQRFFKRAMFSVLCYVIALTLYILNKDGFSLWILIKEEIQTWSFQLWYIILSLALLVSAILMGLVSLIRVNRNNKS